MPSDRSEYDCRIYELVGTVQLNQLRIRVHQGDIAAADASHEPARLYLAEELRLPPDQVTVHQVSFLLSRLDKRLKLLGPVLSDSIITWATKDGPISSRDEEVLVDPEVLNFLRELGL